MAKTHQIILRVCDAMNSRLKREAKKCSRQVVISKILSNYFGLPFSQPRVGKRKKQ